VDDLWTVTATPLADRAATGLLRRYFADVASSYWGRPATDAEVTEVLIENPSDDVAVFLVGRRAGVPAGCVGLRFDLPGFATLTRMFVTPAARGTGGGATLLAHAEDRARDCGAHTMRLDTRQDLTSARRLYETHGYQEVPAFSHGQYQEVWYAKELAPSCRPAAGGG
jgi:GNAT superfamily N-acetyltransferase